MNIFFMLTFVCVLKTNNKIISQSRYKFKKKDVFLLKKYIKQHYTKDFNFYCLTDIEKISGIDTIPLTNDYSEFWSKIELFKHDLGKTVYLDLDCIILKNIDWLDNLEFDENIIHASYQTLHNKKWLNSSFMIWMNSKKNIVNEFNYKEIIKNNYYVYGGTLPNSKEILDTGESYRVGDQAYIQDSLEKHNYNIKYIDNQLVNFYKFTTIEQRKELNILFFSGFPKLNQCYFSDKHKTFILNKNKIENIKHNELSTIFQVEYIDENFINHLIKKMFKKPIRNLKDLLNFKIKIYEHLLEDLCNNSDMLIMHKDNYLNIIENCKKQLDN